MRSSPSLLLIVALGAAAGCKSTAPSSQVLGLGREGGQARYLCASREASEHSVVIELDRAKRDELVKKKSRTATVSVSYSAPGRAAVKEQMPLNAAFVANTDGSEMMNVWIGSRAVQMTGFMTKPGSWQGWAKLGDQWVPLRCEETNN